MKRAIDLLWEVPSSIFTWLGYRTARAVLRRATVRYFERRPEEATRWRWLGPSILEKPIALPAVMTSAPRWNPHAMIASVGPLEATSTIAFDRGAVERSAPTWTIVVYGFPRAGTIARIGSSSPGDSFALEPGRYTIGLRYYRWADPVELPAIEVDGAPLVEPATIPGGVDAFYRTLAGRRHPAYRVLHHHVHTLLRLARFLPARFVESEYLPVGNPETTFRYGAVRAGDRIELEFEPGVLASSDVYFTLYERDSFPVRWYRIESTRHVTDPAARSGFWLVRIVER